MENNVLACCGILRFDSMQSQFGCNRNEDTQQTIIILKQIRTLIVPLRRSQIYPWHGTDVSIHLLHVPW